MHNALQKVHIQNDSLCTLSLQTKLVCSVFTLRYTSELKTDWSNSQNLSKSADFIHVSFTWTTLTTKTSERGSVKMMRTKENTVRAMAHTPGPSSQPESTKCEFFCEIILFIYSSDNFLFQYFRMIRRVLPGCVRLSII